MRTVVAATVACLSIVSLSHADDVRAAIKKSISIPAQELVPALHALSHERQIHVIYLAEDVKGRRTAGASGTLTIDEALQRILSGTGLTYQRIDEQTVSILPVAAPLQPVDSPPPALPATQGTKSSEAAKSHTGSNERQAESWWSRFRLAQTGPTNDAVTTSEGGTGTDESGQPKLVLEEVIVSAQKREERLNDVPMSISVMRGEDLDTSTSQGVMQALTRVPGVGMFEGFQSGGPLISVRGVTAVGVLSSGANPIAYYLDSVPFSFVKSAITPDASGYDLERVEVLRGPQSTLYGASAQNGVVRVLTKDASLDRFEFKARTGASQTQGGAENYRGDVALNLPIIEGKLAARAVAGYQDLSGWVDKPNDENSNDGQIVNLRLKVNAQPTEDLSIGLTGWLSRSDFGAPSTGLDNQTHRSTIPEPIDTDYDVFGLKIGYEFTAVSLTSATSYIDYRVDSRMDTNPTSLSPGANILDTNLANRVFSQEMYLGSTHEGLWRWSLGAMYRNAEDELFQLRHTLAGTPTGGYVRPSVVKFLSKSSAVFGELTRLFADGRWELTAGMRYFKDEVGQRELSVGLEPFGPRAPVDTDRDFTKISPRVVLSWHPTQQMTAYASYAEGFRSGIDQTPAILTLAPALPPAEPDNLTNYEIGAKGNLFNGLLAYDTAIYYMDWEDVQRGLTVVYQSVLQPALVNAGSASGLGFDLGLTAQIDALTVDLNFSVNELAQDADVTTNLTPTTSAVLYREGDRLPVSSEYTISGGAAYTFPLWSAGYSGELSASASHISERATSFLVSGVLTRLAGDPITIAGTRFTVKSPHRWEVSLFADNVMNEDGTASRHPSLPEWTSRARPRTIGLQFDYSF